MEQRFEGLDVGGDCIREVLRWTGVSEDLVQGLLLL